MLTTQSPCPWGRGAHNPVPLSLGAGCSQPPIDDHVRKTKSKNKNDNYTLPRPSRPKRKTQAQTPHSRTQPPLSSILALGWHLELPRPRPSAGNKARCLDTPAGRWILRLDRCQQRVHRLTLG